MVWDTYTSNHNQQYAICLIQSPHLHKPFNDPCWAGRLPIVYPLTMFVSRHCAALISPISPGGDCYPTFKAL